MNARLNKRERRAAALLNHYATFERLASYLGVTNPDGKRISVALWKAEKMGTQRAERMCSDSTYTQEAQDADKEAVLVAVCRAFSRSHKYPPPGFFINSDPRGYALKIDNETKVGRELIARVGLHTDMGGYGILSPEITGD